MLTPEEKRRNDTFALIKSKYEERILRYDFTVERLHLYINVYMNIAVMLENLKANKGEIKYRLGNEFDKWFFETHSEIMDNFWEGKL